MTNYPAKIDTNQSLPSVIDNQTPVQGIIFNRLRDTIIAVEEELGVEPSGIYGSVAARLDVLENITGNLQIVELHNDLGGTLENPLVIGIQGRPISDVSPELHDILIWNGISWEPSNAITGLPPSGPAGRDLGGTYPSPTVVAIQGYSISSSAPSNGDVLTYSSIDSKWEPMSVAPGFTAGGDLAGTTTSQQVISLTGSAGNINIASTGNVFNWNSATTAPGIKQANNTSANATGATISITAQAVTGTGTTTSGGLSFSSGVNTGSTTGNIGNILFTCPTPVGSGTYGEFHFDTGQTNSTLIVARNPGVQGNVIASGQFLYIQSSIQTNLQSPAVSLGNGYTLSYNGSVSDIKLTGFFAATSINIGFTDDATASRTGANVVLSGQNETGTTSIGGNVVLTPGTGTSSNGIIQINGNTNIPAANYIEFGSHSTAATAGYLRTQNGQVDQIVISARNPTNTLDVPIIQYSGSLLIIGGTDAGNVSTFVDTRVRGSQVTLENTTMQLSLVGGAVRTAFASSTLAFNGAFHGNNPFVFDSADNSVTDWAFKINTSRHFNINNTGVITIDNLSTGVVHADSSGNLTSSTIVNADVNAAAAIDVSKLAPGTSTQILLNSSTPTPTWTTMGGDATISSTGVLSVTALTGSSGSIVIGTSGNIITWNNGVTSPGIKQADLTTNSGTGQTLTIQAQNETGTTSIGGDLTLTSGTGTTANGLLNLQSGGTTVLSMGKINSGTGIISLADTSTLPTTASTSAGLIYEESTNGLHYIATNATSSDFFDNVVAPKMTGTVASHAMKKYSYFAVGTTVNGATFDVSIPVPTNKGITIRGFHCGRTTAGGSGDTSSGTAVYGFKNVTGTVTQATSDLKQGPIVTNASLTGGFQGTISGTNALYRITGTSGFTIDWSVWIDVIIT